MSASHPDSGARPGRRALDARWWLAMVGFGGAGLFFVIRAALKDGGVIVRNREFAQRLLDGTFLYEGNFHATYPPSWAVGMMPLAWMPVPVARVAWALLQVVAVVLVARVWLRMTERAGLTTRAYVPLFALALLLISRFLVRDFAGGGPAFLLFALMLAGVWQYMQGRDLAAGVLIGLAAGLKVTPGLLVVYFLWKRQWRVAGAALATVAVLFVAALPFLGWDTYLASARFWIANVLGFLGQDDVHQGEDALVPFTWMNQSLRCALYRLLVAADVDHPLFVNFLNLDPATATWIVRAALAAVVLWLGWTTRRPVTRTSPRLLVEVALVLVFSVLLSPVAWRTYFVTLLPALYLVLHEFHHARPRRHGLLLGLVAYLLLTLGMSQELWGRELKNILQAYYTVTWAAVLLVAMLLCTRAAGCCEPSPRDAP